MNTLSALAFTAEPTNQVFGGQTWYCWANRFIDEEDMKLGKSTCACPPGGPNELRALARPAPSVAQKLGQRRVAA